MFETIFNLFSAWNALLYLLAGGTVLGLGLLVVGYAAYVRFAERCYQGQIVGVRSDAPGKRIYWPLIAYTDDAGTRHEVLADSGSSATAPVSFLATGLENTAAFYILQQSRKMTFK